MQEEVKEIECTLCKVQIDIKKYRLHDAACVRQNYLCKCCGKAVLKSEREYHDEEVCGKDVTMVEEEAIFDQKVTKTIESKTETAHAEEEEEFK